MPAATAPAPRIPRCTYRVQLHPGFTFDHLEALVPYLHALGVSDVYCSPIFRPTAGSLHGYDVCDYRLINPELGGDVALHRLSARLKAHGMGLLLDFVPNHMGIDGPFNRWWRDVLEHGLNSAYARFFDIHWHDLSDPGRARVFVPLLPDHYGVLLEQGKLRLVHEDGELALVHEQTRFPLRPETYADMLREIAPEESEKAAGVARADPLFWKQRLNDILVASPQARAALDAALQRLNGTPGHPGSFDELDQLIDRQHYRLARWQAGAHGTNYRRFFAIDTLVGMRMEDARIFDESHARLRELIRDGVVTGVRIDHVDGLRDPEGYLERLQTLASPAPLYVLVEKILGRGEPLMKSWATQGTTGYEFVGQLAGLFTDARNADAFDRIYAEFTGGSRADFATMVYEKKRLILDEMFANTVLTLATTLRERIAIDRRWRDFTVAELSAGLREVLAGFRVYRTYRRRGPASAFDRGEIEHATNAALMRNPRIEPAIIHFIRDVLLGEYPEPEAIPAHREAMNDWALTVQQYTGAITAKATEDTAYYTFNRLIALNEVGGEPAVFGAELAEFHEANRERAAATPHAMLTTSTHDTKISEDVRARLYALSEIPDEWQAWLNAWRELNAVHKTDIDGRMAPDADEEYRLYQTLLGAWTLPAREPDDAFRERIRGYLRKAVNEAKVNTSILHPNEPWMEACDRFVDALLRPGADNAFLAHFESAAARLARLGVANSLAQVVLKLTAPGVPDVYQGNEAWDFSLVDPDNRRPVDHGALQTRLAALEQVAPGALMARWESGDIKLALTQRILGFRRAHPELFAEGIYTPVAVDGPQAEHVVAFAREHGPDRLLVIVSRFHSRLPWPAVGAAWTGNRVRLGRPGRTWTHVLAGGSLDEKEDGLGLEEVLAGLPVAILHARTE